MDLFSILIALGMERILGLGARFRPMTWFDGYLSKVLPLLQKRAVFNGPLGIALVLLPLLLFLFFVLLILGSGLWGVLAFLFGSIVLWYFLGPEDLEVQVNEYLSEKDDDQLLVRSEALLKNLNNEEMIALSGNARVRAISQAILWLMHERVLAVVFWFLVLGPCGALLYRLAVLLDKRFSVDAAGSVTEQALARAAAQLHAVLAWAPARLSSLSYVLAGNFVPSFGYWRKHVLDRSVCRDLVTVSGEKALNFTEVDEQSDAAAEHQQALDLSNRAVIIWLVGAALYTLGFLLYPF